jgi:hypothetical protein
MQVHHKHYVLPGKKCYIPIFSSFSSPPDADSDAPLSLSLSLSLSQRVSENLGFLVAKLQLGFLITENPPLILCCHKCKSIEICNCIYCHVIFFRAWKEGWDF